MYRKRKQFMELIVCIADAGAMALSLLVAGIIRYGKISILMNSENIRGLYSSLFILHVAAFYFLKIYNGFFKRGRYNELFLSVKYNLVLVAGATLLGFGFKHEVFTSRLVMGYFFVLNILAIWITNLFIRNRERVFHWNRRRVTNLFVVTTRERLPEIVDTFKKSKETTWNIMGAMLLGEEESA